MKIYILSLLLVIAAGCGMQETPSSAKTQATPPEDSQTATSTIDPASSTPANSPEELVAAYKTAFERGDKVAIQNLIYWKDIAADHQDWTLRATFAISYADGVNGKLKALEIRDLPEDWVKSDAFPLPPTKILWGHYSGDGGGGGLRIPIGEIDGGYLFCARKSASQLRKQ